MSNTNYQTIHQMGMAIANIVKQATGREDVQNVNMDFVTVARNRHMTEEIHTGNPATFETNAIVPMGLLIPFAPVQDLHGQDAPYPAGGGANRWDEQWELGIYSSVDGEKVNSTLAKRRIRTKNLIPILPETTYCKIAPTGGFQWVAYYDAEKTFLSSANLAEGNKTFTTPSGAYYLTSWTNSDDYGTSYKNDMGFNYPSTANSYAPWENLCPISGWTGVRVTVSPTPNEEEGTTYSIAFPSSAGTVYGGTLTINKDGSGTLIVDRAKYTYTGEESFTYSTSTHTYYESNPTTGCPGMKVKPYPEAFVGKSNKFAPYDGVTAWGNITSGCYVGYVGTSVGVRFSVNGGEVSDIASLVAGTEVVYELATPVEIDITELEVIETLNGVNNVWSDTGDITVEFTSIKEDY